MGNLLATNGILSIGEMGLSLAILLIAHHYAVVTDVSDRSQSLTRILPPHTLTNPIPTPPSTLSLLCQSHHQS